MSTKEVDIQEVVENDLIESKNHFQRLFDNAPIGIFHSSLEGKLYEVNERLADILGYGSPEELISTVNKTDLTECVYLDKENRLKLVEKVLRDDLWHSHESKFHRKEGSIIVVKLLYRAVSFDGSVKYLEGFVKDITKSKEAEEKIQCLANAVESSDDAIITESLEGVILSWNKGAKQIYGYSSREILGKSISILEPDNLEGEAKQLIRRVKLGENIKQYETLRRKKDNTIVNVSVTLSPVFDTSGELVAISTVARDITERKKAEEHFRKEVERESFLLELYKSAPQLADKELYECALDHAVNLTNSDIGFFHFISDDQKTVILDTWNSKALRTCNASFKTHYPIEQAGNWVDCIKNRGPVIYNDFKNSPNRKGFPEGHVRVKRFMSIPIFDGDKVKFVFGVGNKIGEYDAHDAIQIQSVANELYKIVKQRHWQQALEKSETKFRELFNNALDIITLSELQENRLPGRFIEVNKATIQKSGYTKEEFFNLTSLDLFAPNSQVKIPEMATKLQKNGYATFEVTYITKNGKQIPAEVNVHIFKLGGKEVVLSIARDITERKQAEEKIKVSLNEKEVLLKEIHHRVKNNLQIISSLLDLQANYVEDKEAVNVLKESQNRVKSMAMIHEMLYQSIDLVTINFSDYIRNLVNDLFYAYGAKSNIKPLVDVEQAFLNIETAIPCGLIISELVSNSLKYAFPNNKIGEISVNINSHNDEFELTIKDSGIGLPENIDFKNVTKSLGLRLVNMLVNQLDGSIELDKTDGTKFHIKFKELEYKKRL